MATSAHGVESTIFCLAASELAAAWAVRCDDTGYLVCDLPQRIVPGVLCLSMGAQRGMCM